MSWECNDCHEIATGKTGDLVHVMPLSRGTCETCRVVAPCYDCSCPGDWPKARRERTITAVKDDG